MAKAGANLPQQLSTQYLKKETRLPLASVRTISEVRMQVPTQDGEAKTDFLPQIIVVSFGDPCFV